MKISVVIPCYNEEKIIKNTYNKIKNVVKDLDVDYEIILEEEGSKDNTGKIIREIESQDNHVKALSYPSKRMGLGWGWKKLFKAATGDLIIMMDADLSIEPTIITHFIKESKNADVIIASRFLGVEAQIPLYRRIMSRTYYFINRILFGLKIKDSQSGFQMYRSKVIRDIELESNGFEVNLELLVKSMKKGFKIKEIPAEYIHRQQDAKFSVIKHGPETLIKTFVLWYKLIRFPEPYAHLGGVD
jgi:glycosyltransferase involved in cell wall biosynthesis